MKTQQVLKEKMKKDLTYVEKIKKMVYKELLKKIIRNGSSTRDSIIELIQKEYGALTGVNIPRKEHRILELYILKDKKRTSGWTQLVAKDEEDNEWVIRGSYCGGIPESHWEKLK